MQTQQLSSHRVLRLFNKVFEFGWWHETDRFFIKILQQGKRFNIRYQSVSKFHFETLDNNFVYRFPFEKIWGFFWLNLLRSLLLRFHKELGNTSQSELLLFRSSVTWDYTFWQSPQNKEVSHGEKFD